MASYRRDRRSQNPATANVGPLVSLDDGEGIDLADFDEDGVDLGDVDAAQNAVPPNVDAPTQGTTPYHQESISRNF